MKYSIIIILILLISTQQVPAQTSDLHVEGHAVIEGSNNVIDTMSTYIHEDPIFANSSTNDFRLRYNSPAINGDLNQSIVSVTDLDSKERLIGSAVDIGTYEYEDNQGCDPTVYLHPNKMLDQNKTYKTNLLIYATNRIVSDNISYVALLGIELGLQFEIIQGVVFEAILDGCP